MGAFRLSESDVVEDVAPVGRMRLSPTDTVEDVAAPAPAAEPQPTLGGWGPDRQPYSVTPPAEGEGVVAGLLRAPIRAADPYLHGLFSPEGAVAYTGIDPNANGVVSTLASGVSQGVRQIGSLVGRAAGDDQSADAINRSVDAYGQKAAEVNPGLIAQAARGTIASLIPSVGGAAVAGAGGAIAGAMGLQSNQSLTQGADKGLKGRELAGFVVREGIIEGAPAAAMQAIGLPGVEGVLGSIFKGGGKEAARGIIEALRKTGLVAAQEIPEELVTEIGHNINVAASGVDPNATSADALWNTAVQTTLQTFFTAGLVQTGSVAKGAAQSVADATRPIPPLPTAAEQNASKPDIIPAADILAQYGPDVAANVGPGLTPEQLADRLNSRANIDTATLPGATVRPDGRVNIFPEPPAGPVSEGPVIDPAAAQQGDPEAVAALVARTKAQTAQTVAAEQAQQNTPLRQYYVDLIRQGATPEEARAKVAARQAEIDPALQRAADVVNGIVTPTPTPAPGPASPGANATDTVSPAVSANQPTETPSDVNTRRLAALTVAPNVESVQDNPVDAPPAGPGRGPGIDGTGQGVTGDGAQAQAEAVGPILGDVVTLEDGTTGTVIAAPASSSVAVVRTKDGKNRRVAKSKIDVSNDPLDIMRSDLRRQGGVSIPKGATGAWWEDFGFTARPQPGLFSHKSRISWDQFAQQYPDLFKDDQGRPDFTPDRFGQLVRGRNVKTIAAPNVDERAGNEQMIAEMPTQPDTTRLAPEQQTIGTLVYKNGEWHQVQDRDGQTVLKDGGIIPVGDQETVRVAGYIGPKDPGYDKALDEYKKQEAVKKLSTEAQFLVKQHGSTEAAAHSLEATMALLRQNRQQIAPETTALLAELRGDTGDLFGATETKPAPKTAKRDMLPGTTEEQKASPETTEQQAEADPDMEDMFRFSSTEAPTATQDAPTDAPTPAQQHIMRRAVQYVATAMGKAFPNGNRIVVFDDAAELPEHLRAGFQTEKTRVGEEGEVHGEFDGDRNSPTYGTTFLHRPDIIRRAKRQGISVEYATERTILHETGTHYGSDVLFGGADMRAAHLNRVYNARAAEVDPYNEAGTSRTARAKLVEEWLTPRIEAATTPEGWKRLTNADKGLLRPVWQGVRRVLRKAGLLRSYNDFEINALAHAMYTGVAKGRTEALAGYEQTFGKMNARGAETAGEGGARFSHASAYDERPEGSAVRGLNFRQGKPDAAMRRQQARDRKISETATYHYADENRPTDRPSVQRYPLPTRDQVRAHEALLARDRELSGARFSSTRRDGDRPLAPNGNPSNLSRGQHEQVRTEALKKWGGDWEVWGHRQFLEGEPVARLTGDEFPNDGRSLLVRVKALLLNVPNQTVRNKVLGEVILDDQGIEDSWRHNRSNAKGIAFAAVPDAIKHGQVIFRQEKWKNRAYERVLLAAPISIGGQKHVVVIAVNRKPGSNRFFFHEVAITERIRESALTTGSYPEESGRPRADYESIPSVLQRIFSVNRPSVLLDENGEPKVVYHGTPQSGFTQFRENSHFTDNPDYASIYTNQSASSSGTKKRTDSPGMYPVYLSIKVPFDTRIAANRRLYEQEFTNSWGNGTPLSERGLPDWTDSDNLIDWIKETNQPFDGLVLDEGGTPEGGHRGMSWVPVAPEQIKSAIGNRGTFDPQDPDIRHSSYSPNRGLRVQDIPQPVALPELTNLTRDLLGGAPGILERLRIRGGRALGVFHGTEGANTPAGRIDLKADIFVGPQIAARRTRAMATKDEMDAFRDDILKASNVNPDELVIRRAKNGKTFGLIAYARDHNYAAQILGHEIGHAADWLEEGSLKRGNILGHIAALHKYMSSTVGAVNAAMTPEQRADMRKDVEKAVRAAGTPSSDKAFSGMVAKEMRARIAAKGLFDKGEIRDELKALTHWWSPFDADNAPDSYKSYRYSAPELYAEALSVMFNNPEQLAQRAPRFWEAFNEFADARPEVKAALDAIQSEIKAGNTPAARLARERQAMAMDEKRRAEIAGERAAANKTGWRDLPKELAWAFWDNNTYVPKGAKKAMMDIAYSGANATQYFRDVDAKAMKLLRDAGVDVADFGVFVKNRRAAHERADLANPGGIRGEDAQALLDTLKTDLGPEKYTAMEDAASGMWEARKENVIGLLEKSGLFNEELMTKIRTNEEYFKFQVQEYLDAKHGGMGSGTAHIYHQLGTLKDVSNPLYPTITQDLSLIHAALTNIGKRAVVDSLTGTDMISEAKRGHNGEWMESPDTDKGLMVLADDGAQKGYYVHKSIADLFKHDPIWFQKTWAALQTLTNLPKRILTSNNPLFGLWNVTRDFQSSLIKLPGSNIPLVAPAKLIWNYGKTARDAARHAFMKQSTDRVARMLKDGELIAGRQWDALERDDVATELERYAALFDQNPMRQEAFWKRAGRAVFDDWNSFLESWGKIAGDRYLEGQGITGDQRTTLVRERAGSPNFLARGQGTKWLNSIFMFSNARAQGLRQTVGAFKESPVSTSVKFAMYSIVPSLLMNALAKGMLGDDDEEKNWLKQAFDCIGEFDKRNYLCIPLWSDGKRTGYTRIPMDHTGQLVHTALWDALNSKDPAKVTDALGQAAGQFPWTPDSLTPALGIANDLFWYANGFNPQDSYKGQPAINQTVFAAGGVQKHLEMAKYEFNKSPAGSLYRFDPPFDVRSKTALDKAFSFPGLAQFKRFYKETDQGLGDAERFAEQAKSAGNAQKLMSAKDVAAAAISGAETRQEAMRLLGKSYRDGKASGQIPSPKEYKFTQYQEVYKNMVDKRFGEVKKGR